LPELGGQRAIITTGRTALERSTKSPRCMRAKVVEVVHRQDCSVEGRRVGNGVRQPELMHNTIDLPDAVPAIRGLTQVEAVEMRERDDWLGLAVAMLYRGEPYGLRLKTRAPEQGLPIGRGFRIGRKIASPSAGRRLPAVPGPALARPLRPETHDNIPRRGEDIPKRNRQRGCSWQICMPPENASRCSAEGTVATLTR